MILVLQHFRQELKLQVFSPNQNGGKKLNQFGYPAQYSDDVLQTWLGIGSQIDGLGHLGEAGLYYNCADEKEIIMTTGLTKYGVHDIPPLVGRGVVLDMAKHMGKKFLMLVNILVKKKLKLLLKLKVLKLVKEI